MQQQFRLNSQSRGFTTRTKPKPQLHEIQNACRFYLAKCEGKYKSKSTRHLYDFANEVLTISKSIEKEWETKLKRQTRAIEQYKTIMKEWEDCFGTTYSKSDVVFSNYTPIQLYNKLNQQDNTIKDQEKQIKSLLEEKRKMQQKTAKLISQNHESSRSALHKSMAQVNDQVIRMQDEAQASFKQTLIDKNKHIKILELELSRLTKKIIPTLHQELSNYKSEVVDVQNGIRHLRHDILKQVKDYLDKTVPKTTYDKLQATYDDFVSKTNEEMETMRKQHEVYVNELNSKVNAHAADSKTTHATNEKLTHIVHQLENAHQMHDFYTLKKELQKIKDSSSGLVKATHLPARQALCTKMPLPSSDPPLTYVDKLSIASSRLSSPSSSIASTSCPPSPQSNYQSYPIQQQGTNNVNTTSRMKTMLETLQSQQQLLNSSNIK